MTTVLSAAVLHDDARLSAEEFRRACGVDAAFIETLVREEFLVPAQREPALAFGAAQIARVRRMYRLQRDFDASLTAAAVMLDLIDEIDRLRSLLRRAGLPFEP